jgi:hypothetical protein
MANQFELMTANLCQMLKELVQTAGGAVRTAAPADRCAAGSIAGPFRPPRTACAMKLAAAKNQRAALHRKSPRLLTAI